MNKNFSTFILTSFLFISSLFSSSFIFAEEGVEYQFVLEWGGEGSGDEQFVNPDDIAIAPDNSVYITDSQNRQIKQFSAQGDFIQLWPVGAEPGNFSAIGGIAIASDGSIYSTDFSYNIIRQFTAQGDLIRSWGSEGSNDGEFSAPDAIAIAPNGNVYVVDYFNNRIQYFTAQGDFIHSWGNKGTGNGQFNVPNDIAIAPDGNVYVVDNNNYRIQQFTAQGDFIRSWGSKGSNNGQFFYANKITIASDGSVYVIDTGSDGQESIQQFTAQGDFIRSWSEVEYAGGQPGQGNDIEIASDGSFYVVDILTSRILKYKPKDKTTITITSPSRGSFAEPSNTPEQAIPILVNDEPQYHLLDAAGDQDWFEFYAEQGIRYTIILPQASIGSAIDPIITLFDEAGIELETVNSSTLGQEEQLNWTATATALFRIRVSNGTSIKSKAKPLALEYAYTINIFLSDAPQQGIIKGLVSDSCQQLGLGKVVITAALSGQITENTFTHKTGQYGIPINPGDYDLNTQIINYQDSKKNVSVQQVTASQVQFSLAPVTDCSQMPVRVADPTILAQQAVANYNDQTGQLIIKDVGANGQSYYAELQDQGGYHFALTDAIELTGSVHSNPARYSFETLLVDMSTVFAFNTLYKVQMKNDGNFLFSLTEATKP